MDYSKSFKKESPFLNVMGMGGGVSSLLTLASGELTYIDDVFSTFLWDGTGSAHTITNGIDVSGEGGLVWIKSRTHNSASHCLYDTERGAGDVIFSNSDSAEAADLSLLSAFTSSGFSLGSGTPAVNQSGDDYCSWTFRKCPGFFDVVTFTSNNSSSGVSVSHSLGSTPGMIIVKSYSDASTDWWVWHNSAPVDSSSPPSGVPAGSRKIGKLNSLERFDNSPNIINSVTSTSFNYGNNGAGYNDDTNTTFVAYLFAHNDGSFGEDSDEAVIKCGTYAGTGQSGFPGNKITLGFEPQWLLIKAVDQNSTDWEIIDSTRGMFDDTTNGSPYLRANLSSQEYTNDHRAIQLHADGFSVQGNNTSINGTSGDDFIYVAIRHPHKPPEAGTEVFAAQATRGAANGTPSQLLFTAGFPVDLMMQFAIGGHSSNAITVDRLRGEQFSRTNSNAAEVNNDGYLLAGSMEGVYGGSSQSADSNFSAIMFKRAPGFFDIVTYNGSNSAQNISHNLGVKPALIICKRRNSTGNWQVYADVPAGGATKYMMLDDTGIFNTNSNRWNNTEPTATQFTLGTYSDLNTSGGTYVAYLFGNLDGICKIGQYTGTGNDITIDCGFNPRFIMIKVCTNSGDGWYVFDYARGINAGNDPWVRFNQSGQQTTNTDIVDPTSGGFIVQAGAGSRANDADGRKYLYWAIA